MGRKKTKEAKIKPGRSFKGKDTKTQYPIKIRNRIIILANENHTKEEVEQMLKLEIPITRTTWYKKLSHLFKSFLQFRKSFFSVK